MPEALSQSAHPPKIFRLRAVTARIKDIILDVTTKKFWVQAHLVISKGGVRSGHFYCELVDIDAFATCREGHVGAAANHGGQGQRRQLGVEHGVGQSVSLQAAE